jgi:hypothetical protein
MKVAVCRPYHAQTVGRTTMQMPDGKSVFKIYYLSIIGRDKPERYEWGAAPFTRDEFESAFLRGGHEGIGFVTAFPHITKVFRYAPSVETVVDVREFHTEGMRTLDVARGDSSHEFACYAEAIIAAEEFRAWASASSVEEYLAYNSSASDFSVISHTKLAAYWQGA